MLSAFADIISITPFALPPDIIACLLFTRADASCLLTRLIRCWFYYDVDDVDAAPRDAARHARAAGAAPAAPRRATCAMPRRWRYGAARAIFFAFIFAAAADVVERYFAYAAADVFFFAKMPLMLIFSRHAMLRALLFDAAAAIMPCAMPF